MRLQLVDVPNAVLIHEPTRCGRCGRGLGAAVLVGERSRQVFELPPIRLLVTEHQARTRRCSCGHLTHAVFPPEATAPTCYGSGIQVLGAYLMGRQHLPVARTAELLGHALGAPVSTGWLASLPPRAGTLLGPFTETVRAQLRRAPVAHFDDTGARVNGTLKWVHEACTENLTLLHLAPKRGLESMESGVVLGRGFAGIAVHDGLSTYRHYEFEQALCGPPTCGDCPGWPRPPSSSG